MIQTRQLRAFRAFRTLGQWTALGAFVGVACGVASAAFLFLLDLVTNFRGTHEWIVYLLPVAGLGIGAIYQRWGSSIKGGNNLIIDTIHDDAPQIPLRMAPMVLIGTVLTHLFGGSAGREGTAVQMGASVADAIAHRFRVGRDLRRIVIAAGIAGGFGSVFGTPIAGLIFGLEVVSVGRIEYDALIPALVAAVVGDQVTRALGIVHTAYPAVQAIPFSVALGGKLALIGGGHGAGDDRLHRIDPLHQGAAWSARSRGFRSGCSSGGSPSSPCGALSGAATTWASVSRQSCAPFTIPTCRHIRLPPRSSSPR